MIVEFGGAVLVQGEAVAVGAERLRFGVVGEGGVARGIGFLNLREQRSAVGEVRPIQTGEVAEGGEEVDGFDDRGGFLAGISHAGGRDDERRSKGLFEEAVLAPDGLLAEVPAVITPEHDDGVFVCAGFLKLGENFADVVVNVADAGGVVAAHFVRVGGVFARVLSVVMVLAHELAGTMPGGLSCGLFRMRNWRQFDVFVGIHVARG